MQTIETTALPVPDGQAEAANPIPYMQAMGAQPEAPPPPKISFSSLDEKIHRNRALSDAIEYGVYFFGGGLLGQVAHAYSFPSLLILTIPLILFVSRDVILSLFAQWSQMRYLRQSDIVRMLLTLGYLPLIIVVSVIFGFFFF